MRQLNSKSLFFDFHLKVYEDKTINWQQATAICEAAREDYKAYSASADLAEHGWEGPSIAFDGFYKSATNKADVVLLTEMIPTYAVSCVHVN